MKCEKCKKGKAVITYSESSLDYSHGFTKEICRKCYIEIIEKKFFKIQENLIYQKKLLIEETSQSVQETSEDSE